MTISTHAPAGGATHTGQRLAHGFVQFLLTPLREGRQMLGHTVIVANFISTHAPAGGATCHRRQHVAW